MNWDRAARASTRSLRDIPSDAFTTRDYAQRFQIARRTACDELNRLYQEGKMHRQLRSQSHLEYWYWPCE